MVDSKREAEKLLKSKASSYTTVKKKASSIMEILDEDGAVNLSSNTKTGQGGKGGGGEAKKRDNKR